MRIKYKNNKLGKQLANASSIKMNFGVNAKRISIRLADIESSPTLAVLIQIRAANCHPLGGDRKGEWAVDVSGNFRMIFELDHDPLPQTNDGFIDVSSITDIRIVEIGDYH